MPTIDELLAPELVDGLDSLPMDEVRSRRDQVQEAADELSYLRRLIQGRLDIVHADLERRSGGATSSVEDLVEDLKAGRILADKGRPSGFGRLPQTMDAPDRRGWIVEELDGILPPERLGHLGDLSEDELRRVADELVELERKVSDRRSSLFDRTNQLQAEIVRRYKVGEASVDTLLS